MKRSLLTLSTKYTSRLQTVIRELLVIKEEELSEEDKDKNEDNNNKDEDNKGAKLRE